MVEDSIIIQFISYASISFKADIYADSLMLEEEEGRCFSYYGTSRHFRICHSCQREGLQRIKIKGQNIRRIKVNRLNITDLVLERCPHLEFLDCSENELIELNIEQCPQLKELLCHSNNLPDFHLPVQNKVRMLDISYNDLKTLVISRSPHLQSVWCNNNQLNSFVIDDCPALRQLNLSQNQLGESMLRLILSHFAPAIISSVKQIYYAGNPGCQTELCI